jgi:hypothetical protein
MRQPNPSSSVIVNDFCTTKTGGELAACGQAARPDRAVARHRRYHR